MKRRFLPKAWLAASALGVFLAVFFSLAGSTAAHAQMPLFIAPGVNVIPAINHTNHHMDLRGHVQLNLFNAPTGRATNMAYSYGSCASCATLSVALQVNVVGNASVIHANNRAIAVNFQCPGCTTTAVSLQYIIVAQGQNAVASADARALVDRMNGKLAALSGDPNVTTGEAVSGINGVLAQFSDLLQYLVRAVATTTANTTPGATAQP